MIGKLELYGIIVAVALLAAFGWGQHRHSQGVDEERGRWEVKAAAATKADLESLTAAVQASNTIAQTTQDKVANIKIVNRTVQNEIQREIKTDVRYVNDCFPDTGRLQWNAISAGRAVVPTGGAIGEPDGSRAKLPTVNGAGSAGQPRRDIAPKSPSR